MLPPSLRMQQALAWKENYRHNENNFMTWHVKYVCRSYNRLGD